MADLPTFGDRFDTAYRIVPYEAAWPQMFEREAQLLREALGPSVQIEHYGSTSVPGLAAKPVVDILVLVDSLEGMWFKPAFELLGYLYQSPGENVADDFPFFGKPVQRPRTFQVHVAAKDSPLGAADLAVRDFLRSHPEEAAAYGALKGAIAATHPGDRMAYIEGKDAYVRDLKSRALTWRRRAAPAVRMASGVDITAFEREHAHGVTRLSRAEGWPTLAANAETTIEILNAPGVVALVAIENGEVVGLAYGFGDGSVQGYLADLLVDTGQRRRGVGRALVAEMFRRLQVERIDLLSTDAGEPFYRSLPHRRMPGYRLLRATKREAPLVDSWLADR